MSASDPGILVVGAGPTGLTLACQLLRRGVPCRVIDQAPAPTDLSRAIGVSTRSLEIFDEAGAADEAVEAGHPIPVANFYSHSGRIGRVATSLKAGTRYPFMLALPQPDTERLLSARVERLGGRVERGVALRELRRDAGSDSVGVVLEGPDGEEQAEARWVVGADGAHSVVRKGAGVDFEGKATDVTFVIVDAHVDDAPVRGEGHYYFHPDGMLVVVPLPDGAWRIAATIRPEGAGESSLDLDYVQRLVDARVPEGRIELTGLRNAGWGAAQVRIHTRVAARFRSGRCLLAGDSAHIYSPVGGQGMNGGIQDAHNLGWKLALVATGRAPDSLLDSYEHERRGVARTVMRATTAQTRMATMRSKLAIGLRNALVARAAKAGALDKRMSPQLAQLDIAYRDSPAVVANGRRGPQGARIPDAPIAGGDGAPATLFGLLKEGGFTLLALSPGDGASVEELAGAVRERYGDLVAVHAVQPAGAAAADDAIVDSEGQLHEHLGAKAPRACLVRPDAHVAYEGPLEEREPLMALLERLLGSHDPSRLGVDAGGRKG